MLSEVNNWKTLSFSAKAEEKGFVSASIRGTSSEPVKFDDFSIQLKSLYSAKLYQENHYYPFGMNMKGLENSDKQTQQNKKEHEFQFNAQTEREESFGLFWDETAFRSYDMQLGRFHQIDPHVERYSSFSGYTYVGNAPINLNDPDGRDFRLTVTEDGNGGWNVSISTTVHVWGEDASDDMANKLQGLWDRLEHKTDIQVTVDGEEYTVGVDVTYEYVGDETNAEMMKASPSKEGSHRRSNTGTTKLKTIMGLHDNYKKGDNFMEINRNAPTVMPANVEAETKASSTVQSFQDDRIDNAIHETGHFLGLHDSYFTSQEAAEPFGLSYGDVVPGFNKWSYDIMSKRPRHIDPKHHKSWAIEASKVCPNGCGETILQNRRVERKWQQVIKPK